MRKHYKISCIAVGSLAVAALFGVAAGSVFGAVSQGRHVSAQRPTIAEKGVQIARFPGVSKVGVFLARDSGGNVCLLTSPIGDPDPAHASGGCNPATSPLGGKAMLSEYGFDGGPAVRTVKNAQVAGVVTGQVAKVALVMSDGIEHAATLLATPTASTLGAGHSVFAYALNDGEYQAGVSLSSVVAYDAAGRVVQSDNYRSVLPG
jgi:hypothetical protein